mmetsp:Transcript_48821/g.72541  ORF Transcript_48821/g.72541 Transcript_48821/m.72541 type:complete len:225 (+) Transcript_48821:35-709(+)|eukprot:CAMPEP_0195520114 /NCGR_PEP_ID=MMETSP0794_2-20130614/16173_1 /TAXON_ID=515487 /ORGANISM="Stephanopyxis turris, Strain CCMP 815" /LENGTH=224 /DNA_ID=CAMNT_0040649399 /DNA_START=35 /DNA_END=709 /DNA_ORIENTATION=+
MISFHPCLSLLCAVFLSFQHSALAAPPNRCMPLAFLGLKKKASNSKTDGSYTPYLYFRSKRKNEFTKHMDSVITELGIEVDSYSPETNDYDRKLLEKLEKQKNPDIVEEDEDGNPITSEDEPGKSLDLLPRLYHRESRQWIKGYASKYEILRWARGRKCREAYDERAILDLIMGVDDAAEDAAMDDQQDEIEDVEEEFDSDDEDMELEEKGRRAIERRRDEGAR